MKLRLPQRLLAQLGKRKPSRPGLRRVKPDIWMWYQDAPSGKHISWCLIDSHWFGMFCCKFPSMSTAFHSFLYWFQPATLASVCLDGSRFEANDHLHHREEASTVGVYHSKFSRREEQLIPLNSFKGNISPPPCTWSLRKTQSFLLFIRHRSSNDEIRLQGRSWRQRISSIWWNSRRPRERPPVLHGALELPLRQTDGDHPWTEAVAKWCE